MEAFHLYVQTVLGTGLQVGEDSLSFHNVTADGVAVGVGAGDGQLIVGDIGVQGDGQLMHVAFHRHLVDGLQVDVAVEPEGAAAKNGQDQHQDQGAQPLFGLALPALRNGLFLFGLLFGRLILRDFVVIPQVDAFQIEVKEPFVLLFYLRLGCFFSGSTHGGGNGNRFLCRFFGRSFGNFFRRSGFGFPVGFLSGGSIFSRSLFHGFGSGLGAVHALEFGLQHHRSGGGDGLVGGAVALQVGCQGLAHFQRIAPAVIRLGGNGLHDDLRDLVVGVAGGGKRFLGSPVPERQLTVVVDLVQQHAQGIGIHGLIEGIHGIVDFRGGIGADVLFRQGSELQGVQLHKAQIADAVFLILGQEDVGGLQIHIQVSGPAADGQGGAKIQAQIHRLLMGHQIAAQEFVQGTLVGADQEHPIAQTAVFHRLHLPAGIGQEALQPGQLLQYLDFLHDQIGLFLEVVHGLGGILVGAGEKQGIQLHGRGRNGDGLDYVFLFRVFLYGWVAADTAAAAHGISQGKPVQQRRNEFLFRHKKSSFNQYIIPDSDEKINRYVVVFWGSRWYNDKNIGLCAKYNRRIFHG